MNKKHKYLPQEATNFNMANGDTLAGGESARQLFQRYRNQMETIYFLCEIENRKISK